VRSYTVNVKMVVLCCPHVVWQFQTPEFAFKKRNRAWFWNKKLKLENTQEWARCQKTIGGIYFAKKWRAETLQRGLEFDYFKPRLKSGIFKRISILAERFVFFFVIFRDFERCQDLCHGMNVAS
jgi:hypothetical protein